MVNNDEDDVLGIEDEELGIGGEGVDGEDEEIDPQYDLEGYLMQDKVAYKDYLE